MFSSEDVGVFGFDDFDDGGDGFYELSEYRLVPLHSGPREICYTHKNLFLSVPLSLTPIVLKTFCGNGLAARDWFLPLSVASFTFWVIMLIYAFNG